jgi:hypothetical protein
MSFGPLRRQRYVQRATVWLAATAVMAGTVSPTVMVHAHADGDRPHCHSGGHDHWHDGAAHGHDRQGAGGYAHSVCESVRHRHECPRAADELGVAASRVTPHAVFVANMRHAHVYWWGVAISLPCGSPDVPGRPHGDDDCACLACWVREVESARAVPVRPASQNLDVVTVPPRAIASTTDSSLLPVPLLPTSPLCDRARQERSGVLRA